MDLYIVVFSAFLCQKRQALKILDNQVRVLIFHSESFRESREAGSANSGVNSHVPNRADTLLLVFTISITCKIGQSLD